MTDAENGSEIDWKASYFAALRELDSAKVEIDLAQSKLDAIQRFIDAQADDPGLWFIAEYATEAYVQAGLRGCHAYVESVIKDGPRPETTKDTCDICGNPECEGTHKAPSDPLDVERSVLDAVPDKDSDQTGQ